MIFFFLGLGLFGIKTFELENKHIVEVYLLGLVKIKTPLDEIENYKIQLANNRMGTFEELIVNRKTGGTIFVQEFDQLGYHELKNGLSKVLKLDNSIKPNYWTGLYKTMCIMLVIWCSLMIGLKLMAQ